MAKKTESNINWKQVMERARRSDNQALYGNSSGSRAVEPYTPRQQQTEQTGRFDWTAIMKTAKEQDGRGTSTPWVKTYTSGGREAAPAASGDRPSQSAARTALPEGEPSAARGTYSPTRSRYKAQGGVTFEQYKAAVDSITQQRYRAMRGMTEEQYRAELGKKQDAAQRGRFSLDKVSEQEFNRSTAMQQKYGSYQNYLRGVYAGYDEAMENARRAKQEQAQREGKVTEQEFNRSTAMQKKYGTYQNYLNGVTTTTDEQTRYQAQNARLDNLGIREDVARYFELDADEDREEKDALRQRFDEMGVTGKDLSDFRALLKNPKLTGDYVGFGEAAADAFISGSSASWLGGQEATHAVAEAGINKAAAWALRDLAKSKVLGGIFGQAYRDSLNALADKLATDIDWSGAQAWQDEYSRIMERATKDRSDVGKFVVENLPSVGSMLLDAGLAGMSGVNPIKETTNLSTLTSMASRAGGNAAVDAKNAGATDGEAILIGLENAAVEVFSEKLFGGNPVYDEDVGLINRAAAKLKNKTLLRVLDSKAFGLVSEGLEEVVAELLEPTFQSLVLDGTLEGSVTAEDLGMSFLGGVFVGVLGDAAGMVSGLSQARQDRYMKQYAKILIRETDGSTNADVQAARDTISDKLAYGRAPDMQDFGRLIDALDKAGESDAAERTVEEVRREASESDVPENMDVEDDIPSNMDVIDEDGDGLPDNMELEADVAEAQNGGSSDPFRRSAPPPLGHQGEALESANARQVGTENAGRTEASAPTGAQETVGANGEPEVRTVLRQAGQEDVRGRVKGDKLLGKVGDTLRQYKARLKEYDARTAELRGLEGANAQQVRNNEPSPHQSPTATASPRGEAINARVQELREQIAQDEAYLEAKERDMQDVASVARARLENERQQKELERETQTLSDKELRETEQSAQAQESAAELAARKAAEEQDAAELERIAKQREYGFAMTQYFISGYFDANDRVQMDIPTYAEAVRVAYGKGRFGWKFKREDSQRGIADEVLQEAYKEGRRKGEENGTAGIGNGGERDAGMDSNEPSGRVGRGAGGAEKESAGGFGVKESLRIQSVLGTAKAERLSPKADGIENGSEKKMFYRVPDAMVQEYPALKQAKQILTDAGADDVRLVSGSIRIRTAGGREMSVQGVTQGTTVWLTIDAKDGVIKTAEHEAMHLRLEAEPGLRERLIDALGLSQEQRDKLARKYCEAYEGCYTGEDMSAYLDEIVCDAYAGINRMGLGADKLQSSVRAAADSTASQRTKKPAQTRGPPARASAAAKERQYEGVNLAEDGSVYTYEFLTSLPDMSVTMLPPVDAVRGNDERVDTAKVVRAGMKNARTVGTERDGKVFVRNDYTGRELRIDTASIRHGLNGSLNRLLTNARLGANIGTIVKNAVPINALRNKASDVTGTYAMAAYAADRRGREFVAIVTVEQRSGNVSGVSAYDVAHAVSGRQKNGSQADTKSQGVYPIKAATISIKDFLGIVNSTHQSILPQDVLAAFKETRNPKGEYADKAKFSPAASPKENDKTALAYFGKTYKWSETGYVLLDGSKLDFSGRHEGGSGGYRSVDHRDISDAFDGDFGDGSYTGGMVQFMQEGNIRISPESGGINLAVMPTRAQMDSLSDFISRERGEVILDIDDENGNTLSSTEYPKGTHANKVLQDIRNYFQNGQTPQAGSEPTVQQFRLSPETRDANAEAAVSGGTDGRTESSAPTETEEAKVYSYDKLPGKARAFVDQAVNSAVRQAANAMSIPGKAKREVLKPAVQGMMNEFLQTGKIAQETINKSFEDAYDAGIEEDREFYDTFKHIKVKLLKTGVRVTPEVRAEFADLEQFRRAVRGRILLNNEGIGIDTLYGELHDEAPGLFPEAIMNPADQLMRMIEVADKIQITKQTLDEAHKGDGGDYKRWAKNDFERSVENMTSVMRTVRRYVEAAERRKVMQYTPQSEEEALKLGEDLRKARKNYERVKNRNLLTDEDERVVWRLLRGEIAPEAVQDMDNARSILDVHQAKSDYDALRVPMERWRRSAREKNREYAREHLTNIESTKDKKGFFLQRETMTRNTRDVFAREDAERINNDYFAQVRRDEAKATRFKNEMRGRVKAMNLSREKRTGDLVSEAHAVQLYGEAMNNIEMLKKKPMDAKRDGKTLAEWEAMVRELWKTSPSLDKAKIESAVAEFRKIYDETLEAMNRKRIENGYEPVPRRSGYFPHFQPGQTDGILAMVANALGVNGDVTELPTTIAGRTYMFRPGIKYFGNAEERLGFNTAYDAVEGFDRYIEGASSVIYQTDNIQRLRALASEIRYMASSEGVQQQVDAIRADTELSQYERDKKVEEILEKAKFQLSGYVNELEEYTNLLAGKKSRTDRDMERDHGRKIYNVMQKTIGRVGANMVALNLRSAATNFAPLVQTAMQHGGLRTVRAMWQTVQNVRDRDGIVERSAFLTNRRGSDPLVNGRMGKISDAAGAVMNVVDNFTAEAVVRVRYNDNLRRGLNEVDAMDEADQYAADVMAARSKGEMPTRYESKNPFTKMLTQFQLEVNNLPRNIFKDTAYYMSKDHPDWSNSRFVAEYAWRLLKYCIFAWLFNEAFESIFGGRVLPDPINMINDFVGDMTGKRLGNIFDAAAEEFIHGRDGEWIETTNKKRLSAALTGLGEAILDDVPGTQVLALVTDDLDGGRLPVTQAIPNVLTIINAATDKDMANDVRWEKIGAEVAKPVTYLFAPLGGGAVKKTAQGIYAVVQGGSFKKNKDGELLMQYPVFNETTGDKILNTIKVSIAGKTATSEAKKWVDNDFSNLNMKETNAYLAMSAADVKQREAWKLIQAMKDVDVPEGVSKKAAKLEALRDYDISDEAKALYYYNVIASDTERAQLDAYMDLDEELADEKVQSAINSAEATAISEEEQAAKEVRAERERASKANYAQMYRKIRDLKLDGYEPIYKSQLKALKEQEGLSDSDARKEIQKGVIAEVKEAFQSGSIDEKMATRILSKNLNESEDDTYWMLEEWKGGPDYSKYGKLTDAMEQNTDAKETVQYYLSHGVQKRDISSQITRYFKPLYKAAETRQEKNEIARQANVFYRAAGYMEKWNDMMKWDKEDS